MHNDTVVHGLPPECKVAGLLLTAVAIVLTPREELWAFVLHALLLAAVLVVAGVSFGHVTRRLAFEIPFLLFALALPFVGSGPTTEWLGLTLRTEGLWSAWNILAKATLVLVATLTLAATTPTAEILRGFERVRAPRIMVAIAGFMVRYADVLSGEVKRMSIARASRGDGARWFWQARAVAGTAGSLFVRSYERGERVHLAMISRGYSGALPTGSTASRDARSWLVALVVPMAALTTAGAGWVLA